MTGPQGWTAPDDRAGGPPPAEPAAAPPAEPPVAAEPPGASGWQAPGAPGWQAPPGWGGPPAPPAGGSYGAPSYGAPPYGAPPYGGPSAGGWGMPRPPEPKPGIVPLRPLGLGELLDGAVTLVRRYPRPTLGLSAGIALVTTLLNVPLLQSANDSALLLDSGTTADLDAALGGLAAGFGASALLSFLTGVVLAGIITAVVGKGVLGQPMTLREAWDSVRPLLGRLLGLAVLVLLLVYGGFTVTVVVGAVVIAAAGPAGAVLAVPLIGLGTAFAVYVYVRLALAPSALVLERAGVRESMRRSGVLVRGDWWRVFGILLLVLVITLFVSSVLQAPFQFGSVLDGFSGEVTALSATDVLVQSIGSALAVTLVAPFAAAVGALLYVDRRMRAEGLDVSLNAAAAGSRRA